MRRFRAPEIDVLVATTMVEVGVDVPNATLMVIEQAESFGLSQLHQLRGRVGRGQFQGYCFLMSTSADEAAAQRLAVLEAKSSGFDVAEADFALRGPGDVLGTRQSGLPEFRMADLAHHGDLVAMARDEAKLIIERDGGLEGPRGPALRTLLYLFERDAAVSLIRSG
jgi:ATP-dependent DNA helicase RecG